MLNQYEKMKLDLMKYNDTLYYNFRELAVIKSS
jgi:hypothetical protein